MASIFQRKFTKLPNIFKGGKTFLYRHNWEKLLIKMADRQN